MGHVQPAERRQGRRRVLLYRLDQGVNELSAAPEWRGRAAVVFLIAFPTADPSRSPLPSPSPLYKYSHDESARARPSVLQAASLTAKRAPAFWWTAECVISLQESASIQKLPKLNDLCESLGFNRLQRAQTAQTLKPLQHSNRSQTHNHAAQRQRAKCRNRAAPAARRRPSTTRSRSRSRRARSARG